MVFTRDGSEPVPPTVEAIDPAAWAGAFGELFALVAPFFGRHAKWDVDAVRDALRAQVAERLGDAGGVLAVDDTGFEKKGRRTAGVQRPRHPRPVSTSTPGPSAPAAGKPQPAAFSLVRGGASRGKAMTTFWNA